VGKFTEERQISMDILYEQEEHYIRLLFILGLLNDVVGSSDYIESNDNMINE
jgi:hypothetical protein